MKAKRQNEIMKLLLLERTLKTEDLARRLNVSVETIRRDINAMEAEKVKIASRALEFIPDGSTVALDIEPPPTSCRPCWAPKRT